MSVEARPFGVAPVAARLIEDPIEFLSAEHGRQIALLAHLDRLARAPAARGARPMAGALLRWLTQELPLHIADEERSLYPRLRPHDAKGVVRRLGAQHRRDALLARATVAGLRRLVDGEAAGADFAAAAADLARLHRAHLEEEEAEITPLARAVLTAATLREMAGEMAARRGLDGRTPCPTAT